MLEKEREKSKQKQKRRRVFVGKRGCRFIHSFLLVHVVDVVWARATPEVTIDLLENKNENENDNAAV